MTVEYTSTGACLSDDELYRYWLYREWNQPGDKAIAFIGLNPSTADAELDDPTIRRCVGFAQQWGYDALYMFNAFAYRATNPSELLKVEDPIGDRNDATLETIAVMDWIERVVFCWGGNIMNNRDKEVAAIIPDGYCFGTLKDGQPKHPLYLPKSTELVPYCAS